MITDEQIEAARELLKRKFKDEGSCQSCGWHGSLHEHDVWDSQIVEALEGDGILRLGCVSDDDEDRASHRGVKINIKEDC